MWRARQEQLRRDMFAASSSEPNAELSPIPEANNEASESKLVSPSDVPLGEPYSPLPDLIIEPEPNRHDDSYDYLEEMEIRVKNFYRNLFIKDATENSEEAAAVAPCNLEQSEVSDAGVGTDQEEETDDSETGESIIINKTISVEEAGLVESQKTSHNRASEISDDENNILNKKIEAMRAAKYSIYTSFSPVGESTSSSDSSHPNITERAKLSLIEQETEDDTVGDDTTDEVSELNSHEIYTGMWTSTPKSLKESVGKPSERDSDSDSKRKYEMEGSRAENSSPSASTSKKKHSITESREETCPSASSSKKRKHDTEPMEKSLDSYIFHNIEYENVATQTSFDSESDESDWGEFYRKLFVGKPEIFKLCSCKDHVCR